jgi:hypothetical protein
MADTLDINGVKNIYLTRQGGREWVMGTVPYDQDPQLAIDGNLELLVDNYYKFQDSSAARLAVLIPEYVPASPTANHAAAVARGWMSSPSDWGDAIEFTCFFNATVVVPNDYALNFMGPTGQHPTSGTDCSGSSYGCGIQFYTNPPIVFFYKELYHNEVVYTADRAIPQFDFELNAHGDIGNKFIIFLGYGPERKFVKLEHWMNGNGDKVTWVKVNETTDTGGWGTLDQNCGGSGDQILNYRNGKMRMWFNWTQTDFKFKYLSVREVTRDANEIPVQPPVVIPPTQAGAFRRIYSIIYDMGEFEGNECLIAPEGGGGGPEPITYEIYNVVPSGGDDTPLDDGCHRQAIMCHYAESQLIGERPAEIEWMLEKSGDPSSEQPITSHIRRGTDDAIVETFDWENGVLTADLLTTTPTLYLFKNPDASYALQEGDYVTVEWTGGTSSNYVKVSENTNNPFDGGNTCKRKFDSGGPPPTDWGSTNDTRDLAAIIRAKG